MDNESIGKTKIIIKNLIISIILTLILIFIFSLILSFTNIGENIITPTIIFISSFSILVGSFITLKKIKKNGILNGILIGGIYMIGLYIISSIVNWNFSLNLNSVIMIIFGMICGALGGILGVNF